MMRTAQFDKTRERFGRRSAATTGRRPENRRQAIGVHLSGETAAAVE